ncbi:MAG TPA: DUF72 domain-containing protein [Candidatus Acidoferrales bacterium]
MASDPADRKSLVLLGASSFTAPGWAGSFYPAGLKPRDYLSYYATRFDTLEIDSTFYACPSRSTVQGWYDRTPPDFIFAAKVPREITHDRVLLDCDAACREFVSTMEVLGEKLGPLLLQFEYFNQSVIRDDEEFLQRLVPFLKKLPAGREFAVEIRNKAWLTPRFVDALREQRVALVLQDQSWMARPGEIFAKLDPITADFTYIRWLGDRKGIEEVTKTWNKTVVDRKAEIAEWTSVIQSVQERKIKIYGYVNNHFAGHAPTTIDQLRVALRLPLPVQPNPRLPFDE